MEGGYRPAGAWQGFAFGLKWLGLWGLGKVNARPVHYLRKTCKKIWRELDQ
jgi:hypothetical protein